MMFFALLLLLSFSPLIGCSRVFWNDEMTKIVIRSMDLNRFDEAKVVINPRETKRDGGVENALSWQAKYGSITTTVFGKGTVDGINEKGLAAHLHYLDGTVYPGSNTLPKIGIHKWIQYFLDTCANVQEVVEIATTFEVVNLKIAGEYWPLFVIVEDASGETAILEYIGGKLHIHQGHSYNVATNDPFFDIHLQNLKNYIPFGGNLSIPTEQDAFSIFVRATEFLNHISPTTHSGERWQKIVSIIQIIEKQPDLGWHTLWLTMSDLQNQHYYFWRISDREAFMIDLNKMDFSQGNPELQINPYDQQYLGDVSSYIRCSLLLLKNRIKE